MPILSLPTAAMAPSSASMSILDVTCVRRPFTITVDTGVSSLRMASPEASWFTVSIFSSFFCFSNVIDTTSAVSSWGWLWGSSTPFLKNLIFLNRRMSVRRFSAWGTFKYSQDRMAKKKAPTASWAARYCLDRRRASSPSSSR
eukprot:scaffold72862_cov23-Cyclotella_meneghiniana.AAC.1